MAINHPSKQCPFCGREFRNNDIVYCSRLCAINGMAYHREGKRFPFHDRHHEDPTILLRSEKRLTPLQEKICTKYIWEEAERIRLSRPDPNELTRDLVPGTAGELQAFIDPEPPPPLCIFVPAYGGE